MSLLAVDVGAGTQDILLYQKSVPIEGCPKMILPSQTVLVGRKIDSARRHRQSVFLHGSVMGGGSCVAAIKRLIREGLFVYATHNAALTIHDDINRVLGMGVKIVHESPVDAISIRTGDLDLSTLMHLFEQFYLELPQQAVVAVQDHGFSATRSNREVRFEILSEAIHRGGGLEQFAYTNPPEKLSRMRAVHDYLYSNDMKSLVMDTGPSAIFGALCDPRAVQPALVVNIGNGHTIAGIVDDWHITALFEHHTSSLTSSRLRYLAERLIDGTLSYEEVFDEGGHGSYIESVPSVISSVVVTGPRRVELASSLDGLGPVIMAAPAGDMMIAGCIGLIKSWELLDKS